MPTFTANLNLEKPDIGQINWGGAMNANLDAIDAGAVLLSPKGKQTISAFPLELAISLILDGAAGGSITIQAPSAAFTAWTLTLPNSHGTNGQVLQTDGAGNTSWVTVAGSGTVTSVGLSLPAIFSVSGSPVTTSGTLTATLVNQNANQVFAGPSSGVAAAPTFRGLVDADIPGSLSVAGSLTNKTLTGAATGNSVSKVTSIDDSGAIVGNGAAQVIFTYNLPANMMQAGKGIRIRAAVSHTGSNSVAYTFSFGSSGDLGAGNPTSPKVVWDIVILNKAGVTNAQTYSLSEIAAASNAAAGTLSQDTTTILTFTLKFTVANTDSVTPIQFLVEQIQ